MKLTSPATFCATALTIGFAMCGFGGASGDLMSESLLCFLPNPFFCFRLRCSTPEGRRRHRLLQPAGLCSVPSSRIAEETGIKPSKEKETLELIAVTPPSFEDVAFEEIETRLREWKPALQRCSPSRAFFTVQVDASSRNRFLASLHHLQCVAAVHLYLGHVPFSLRDLEGRGDVAEWLSERVNAQVDWIGAARTYASLHEERGPMSFRLTKNRAGSALFLKKEVNMQELVRSLGGGIETTYREHLSVDLHNAQLDFQLLLQRDNLLVSLPILSTPSFERPYLPHPSLKASTAACLFWSVWALLKEDRQRKDSEKNCMQRELSHASLSPSPLKEKVKDSQDSHHSLPPASKRLLRIRDPLCGKGAILIEAARAITAGRGEKRLEGKFPKEQQKEEHREGDGTEDDLLLLLEGGDCHKPQITKAVLNAAAFTRWHREGGSVLSPSSCSSVSLLQTAQDQTSVEVKDGDEAGETLSLNPHPPSEKGAKSQDDVLPSFNQTLCQTIAGTPSSATACLTLSVADALSVTPPPTDAEGETGQVDVILTDLPFGKKMGSFDRVARLYPRLFARFAEDVKEEGLCLLCTARPVNRLLGLPEVPRLHGYVSEKGGIIRGAELEEISSRLTDCREKVKFVSDGSVGGAEDGQVRKKGVEGDWEVKQRTRERKSESPDLERKTYGPRAGGLPKRDRPRPWDLLWVRQTRFGNQHVLVYLLKRRCDTDSEQLESGLSIV
uniref:Ribosomal RNA large subunit methyltransferase K/L-like methyltransferase domain-containing protein n=1 Tax=Chromera velia CCMP2878 TaxID=1169474 RepID=A0A0G4GNL8_9ALVE|eukprot:Cvel_4980.t1-p1 / transcript=Cvel_4980.t1 / gene=Cvel_4980 / organism=Chromera_velia_CCMP2878 / gene_product=hypothetical protein / transcript_product=hypothetical protein / location=Cvel_scaffold225:63802-66300(-) / protein_length=727 / sequence_SO=supercontig / SO=protein_coding / is_pseudo=false